MSQLIPRAFDEILYILMNGVGFSVERQDVIKLPNVADELHETDTTIVVADSKLGWAKSLKRTNTFIILRTNTFMIGT